MQKNILCFFRAALGDFYLSFPLFYTLRNTYKKEKLTLVASSLATPLLHEKGPWFDEIIHLEDYKPQKQFDRVFDLAFVFASILPSRKYLIWAWGVWPMQGIGTHRVHTWCFQVSV